MIFRRLKLSFLRAGQGLKTGWKQEYNLRVFTFITGLVFLGILGLRPSALEDTILILTISVMISLELLNSQIERFLDLVSPQKSYLVKDIKDLSAGAVLISAMGSLVIGVIIFFPYLIKLFR